MPQPSSRNPRPRILHLLPEFQAGATLALAIDLAKKLTEYYHVLLTNRPPAAVGQYQDELCAKLNLDVRYTVDPVIGREDILACRPDVVILYDVRGADLHDPDDLQDIGTIYYAHYRNDVDVSQWSASILYGTRETFDDSPGITNQNHFYFPPYVDHKLVIDAANKPYPLTRKRVVAILGGRSETYDFNFASSFINGIDRKRVAVIVPSFLGVNKTFDRAVATGQADQSIFLCPHVPGATFNAYRRAQTLISTGAFRIDTECGALRRPVIKQPDSVEEAIETVEKSLVNRRFVDELIDYGRLVAAQRQLDLHLHKFSNLVRRLY
jgi:hypothetical protein